MQLSCNSTSLFESVLLLLQCLETIQQSVRQVMFDDISLQDELRELRLCRPMSLQLCLRQQTKTPVARNDSQWSYNLLYNLL